MGSGHSINRQKRDRFMYGCCAGSKAASKPSNAMSRAAFEVRALEILIVNQKARVTIAYIAVTRQPHSATNRSSCFVDPELVWYSGPLHPAVQVRFTPVLRRLALLRERFHHLEPRTEANQVQGAVWPTKPALELYMTMVLCS